MAVRDKIVEALGGRPGNALEKKRTVAITTYIYNIKWPYTCPHSKLHHKNGQQTSESVSEAKDSRTTGFYP